jgi:hypothetical protein
VSGAAGEEDEPSSPLLSYWGASCVGGGGVSFPTVLGSISLAFVDMGLATGGCFPSLLLEASLDGASALGVAPAPAASPLGGKVPPLEGGDALPPGSGASLPGGATPLEGSGVSLPGSAPALGGDEGVLAALTFEAAVGETFGVAPAR